MQTLAQLKAQLQPVLWPAGEASNLVDAHNKAFIEALIEIQRWVFCYQYNNGTIYNGCSILFQCGMSVITAPKGAIFRVSTFDRINPVTGAEDINVPISWCSEVIYQNVPYATLKKFVDAQLATRCSCVPQVQIPGACGGWPLPTNAGYIGYPELPVGFIYPQASLDRTGNCVLNGIGCAAGRSRVGVWAQHNGRIYLAPWLQSTEVIMVGWNGIVRDWNDSSIVSSDPDYVDAVKKYVWMVHYRDYERDTQQFQIYEAAWANALAELIRDCREETRAHGGEASLATQSLETLQGQSPGPIVIAPPDAPTNAEATADSSTQITVTWDFSGDTPLGFIIERKFGDEWIVVGTVGPGADSFTDTGLTAGEEYCYRVRAYNTKGNSEPSEETCATTVEAPPTPNLVNVDFTATVPTTKVGLAATGYTAEDFWNTFGPSQGQTLLALLDSAGYASGVTIQSTGASGGSFSSNGNTDPMVSSFYEKNTSPFAKEFTLTGIAAGTYDLYLYGYGTAGGSSGGVPNAVGEYVVLLNGTQFPTPLSYFFVLNNDNAPPWVNNGNYVMVPNIPIAGTSDTILINAFYEGGTRYGRISGLQLKKQ